MNMFLIDGSETIAKWDGEKFFMVHEGIKQALLPLSLYTQHFKHRSTNPTASSSTEPAPSAEAAPSAPEEPDCVICLERKATWVFSGCGHLCLCKCCSRKLNKKKAAQLCPMCRVKGKPVAKGHYDGDLLFRP